MNKPFQGRIKDPRSIGNGAFCDISGFWPLYNVTGSPVLVVMRVLDLPLHFIVIIIDNIIIIIIITVIINIIFITFIITRLFEQEQLLFL